MCVFGTMSVMRSLVLRGFSVWSLLAVVGVAQGLQDVHALIQPHPGESHWMRVPWRTSVWEARKQAAKEGKPIFIWAGSGGGPIGVC